MTALFALAPATGLARQDNQDAAYAEAAGCSPSPTAWAAIPPGMGTTLTALLFSDGHAALVQIGDSRALPGAARGRPHVRRCLPARCARAYWRTIAVTMCPDESGHK